MQLGTCAKRYQHTNWHQDRKRSTKLPPSPSLCTADLDPNVVSLQVVPFPPGPSKASSNPGSGNITDAKLQRGKHFLFTNKSQPTGLSSTAYKSIHLTHTTPAGKQILGVNWTFLPSSYRNKYSSRYFRGWLRTDETGRAAGAQKIQSLHSYTHLLQRNTTSEEPVLFQNHLADSSSNSYNWMEH